MRLEALEIRGPAWRAEYGKGVAAAQERREERHQKTKDELMGDVKRILRDSGRL